MQLYEVSLKIYISFKIIFIFELNLKKDGSLNDIINEHKKNNKLIPFEKLHFWSIQILKGIHFLHSKQIWHRDIKPDNIFLHGMQLVLGDLGLARNQQPNLNKSLSFGFGTIYYIAPEVIKGFKNYTEKIDIW